MDVLGERWRAYRTEVMDLNAPADQAQECRRAFYAGAQALIDVLLTRLAPGHEPTVDDLRLMDNIQAEIVGFVERVKAGLA